MLRIKNILMPTDFSACAESAFSHAAHLADRYGAELHVLNVRPPHSDEPNDPMDFFPLEREDEITWSDAYRPRDGQQELSIVHAQVREVAPAVGILEYADRHDVDLIVMGTHGRRGIDRLLIGSTAEEVVRMATCPVFTVREEAGLPHGTVRRILVPVDLSATSRSAVTYAKELAAAYGAHLDLLHVIEDAGLAGVYGIEPPMLTTPAVAAQARRALAEEERVAVGAEVTIEHHVLTGHAVHSILEFAETRETDMIVIATHGWAGIKRLLLGSVTEKVVRMAPCPVFTVKSFGKKLIAPAKGARLQDGPEQARTQAQH